MTRKLMQRIGFWTSPRKSGAMAAAKPSDHAHEWLAHAPAVCCLVLAYLAVHFALRLNLSPTLGIDDAEQILFAQHWALGYRFRQPPLFTWLLVPVVDWVGPGVLAVSIVRYGLLAFTYGFLYLAALSWIDDRRLAALSVLSFWAIYVFAYFAHHDLTHTTALGTMIAASLLVFTKLSQQPTTVRYLLLGLCFGLGMLAKWNFVMLAIGLPLTCLMCTDYRHLVLNWRCALSIAVMALIISPTAFWMFSHGQSTGSVSTGILSLPDNLGFIDLAIQGGMALLTSIILFPMPFLPIFLVVFGAAIVSIGPRHLPATSAASTGRDPSFLGWLMLVILGLHALLIPLFGAVNFTERWMHPALMILPLFLFAVLARHRPAGRTISFYLGVIAILVAVSVGARLYRYLEGADQCGSCREFAPFAALADDLREAGFDRGTIVVDGMHMGGNLKMAFPESRVIDPAFPLALWPSQDDHPDGLKGMCLLAWRADDAHAPSRRHAIRRFAEGELGVSPDAVRESGSTEAPLYRSSNRSYELAFELIKENTGGCR